MLRTNLACLLLALGILCVDDVALAQGTGAPAFNDTGLVLVTVGVVSLGLLGGAVLTHDIIDIVSYAEDRPVSGDRAALDLVLGSVLVVGTGVGLGVLGGSGAFQDEGFRIAGAIGGSFLLASGAHMIIHGIWSLLEVDRRARGPIEVSPTLGGLSVSGTF